MKQFVNLIHSEDDGDVELDVDMDGGMDPDLGKEIKKRADRRARRKLREKQKQISLEEEVLKVRKKIARSKKKTGAELAGKMRITILNYFSR